MIRNSQFIQNKFDNLSSVEFLEKIIDISCEIRLTETNLRATKSPLSLRHDTGYSGE